MTNYSADLLQLNPSLRPSRKRIACAVQLYDDWGGYYVLQRLDNGAYIDVRPLSREEAMTYRIANDETLKLVFETIAPNSPA